jgi:hypothetical protein
MISINKYKFSHLCAAFILFMSGCGGGSSSGETTLEDSSLSEEIPMNPIVVSQEFGVDGNLYKPRSDENASGEGNLVVLLSSRFTTQFDSCEIQKRSGELAQLFCLNSVPWTDVPYSCFSNGGRQTWRATFKCDEVAQVKVVCRDANQEVTFTVPDANKGNICTRFG